MRVPTKERAATESVNKIIVINENYNTKPIIIIGNSKQIARIVKTLSLLF